MLMQKADVPGCVMLILPPLRNIRHFLTVAKNTLSFLPSPVLLLQSFMQLAFSKHIHSLTYEAPPQTRGSTITFNIQ